MKCMIMLKFIEDVVSIYCIYYHLFSKLLWFKATYAKKGGLCVCAFGSKIAGKKDQIPEFFLEDDNDGRTAGSKTTRPPKHWSSRILVSKFFDQKGSPEQLKFHVRCLISPKRHCKIQQKSAEIRWGGLLGFGDFLFCEGWGVEFWG